jgi:hypothetical protein
MIDVLYVEMQSRDDATPGAPTAAPVRDDGADPRTEPREQDSTGTQRRKTRAAARAQRTHDDRENGRAG